MYIEVVINAEIGPPEAPEDTCEAGRFLSTCRERTAGPPFGTFSLPARAGAGGPFTDAGAPVLAMVGEALLAADRVAK